VVTQTTETNTSAPHAIMDDDIFEWEIEEEVVGEMIANFFLKGEELEEPSIGASLKLELKPLPS
ncbi:hypothetical protein HAX54_022202, partial [Datura stramonium]|nr:hypothetical protein [Datura stramonium]